MTRVVFVLASSFIVVVIGVGTLNDQPPKQNISLNLTETLKNTNFDETLINVYDSTQRGKAKRQQIDEHILLKSDDIKINDVGNSTKLEVNIRNENVPYGSNSAFVNLVTVHSLEDVSGVDASVEEDSQRSTTSGYDITSVDEDSQRSTTSGYDITSVDEDSQRSTTSGYDITSVDEDSQRSTTSGYDITSVDEDSQRSTTSGYDITSVDVTPVDSQQSTTSGYDITSVDVTPVDSQRSTTSGYDITSVDVTPVDSQRSTTSGYDITSVDVTPVDSQRSTTSGYDITSVDVTSVDSQRSTTSGYDITSVDVTPVDSQRSTTSGYDITSVDVTPVDSQRSTTSGYVITSVDVTPVDSQRSTTSGYDITSVDVTPVDSQRSTTSGYDITSVDVTPVDSQRSTTSGYDITSVDVTPVDSQRSTTSGYDITSVDVTPVDSQRSTTSGYDITSVDVTPVDSQRSTTSGYDITSVDVTPVDSQRSTTSGYDITSVDVTPVDSQRSTTPGYDITSVDVTPVDSQRSTTSGYDITSVDVTPVDSQRSTTSGYDITSVDVTPVDSQRSTTSGYDITSVDVTPVDSQRSTTSGYDITSVDVTPVDSQRSTTSGYDITSVDVTPVDSQRSTTPDYDVTPDNIYSQASDSLDLSVPIVDEELKLLSVTGVYIDLDVKTGNPFLKTSQIIGTENDDKAEFPLFSSSMLVAMVTDEPVSENSPSPISTFHYEEETFPLLKNKLSTSSLLQTSEFVSVPPRNETVNMVEAVSHDIDMEQKDSARGFVPKTVSMPNRTLYHVYSAELTSAVPTATCATNLSEVLVEFRRLWPVEEWKEHGLFTEEYLTAISPHWLSFPPPSRASHYILAGLYTLIMVVGVCGNALVIFMFLRCKSLKTPANILVLNLAVSDLLMLIKMPVFIYNSIKEGPALGEIGCQVYGFLGGLTGIVSIATLAAIGLDRYYVIVHPLDPIRRTTRLRARLCVLFVWLYGLVFSIIPLTPLNLNRYVPEGYLTSCSFDYLNPAWESRAFVYVFFTAAWILPFCVLTFSYLMICRVVILAREVKPGSDSSRHCREHDKRRTELRLAEVVLGVVGLWFVSWTPYAIVALLGVSGNKRYITPLASMVPALFCKMASCVDPFVYAVTHPRFRQELVKMYHRMKRKRKKSNSWTPNVNAMREYRRPTNSNSFDIDIDQMMVVVDFEGKQYPEESCYDDDDVVSEERNNVYAIPMKMFSSDARRDIVVDEMPPMYDHQIAMEMTLDEVKAAHSGSSYGSKHRGVSSSSTTTSHSSRSKKSLKARETGSKHVKCSDEMDNPLYNDLMQQWGKEAITSTPKGKKNKTKPSDDVLKKSKTKKLKYPRKLLGKSPKQQNITFGKCEVGNLENGFMLSFNQLGVVKPPSWFNSPKPHANRATSLRIKSKPKEVNEKDVCQSEPITV